MHLCSHTVEIWGFLTKSLRSRSAATSSRETKEQMSHSLSRHSKYVALRSTRGIAIWERAREREREGEKESKIERERERERERDRKRERERERGREREREREREFVCVREKGHVCIPSIHVHVCTVYYIHAVFLSLTHTQIFAVSWYWRLVSCDCMCAWESLRVGACIHFFQHFSATQILVCAILSWNRLNHIFWWLTKSVGVPVYLKRAPTASWAGKKSQGAVREMIQKQENASAAG